MKCLNVQKKRRKPHTQNSSRKEAVVQLKSSITKLLLTIPLSSFSVIGPMHVSFTWRGTSPKAATNAFTAGELVSKLNAYLEHPELNREDRKQFVTQELTYLHGESTPETARYLLQLLGLKS